MSPGQEPSIREELRAVAAGGAIARRRIHPPTSPHLILNPVWLPPAKGFAHVVVPAHGLLVFLGGQAGHRPDGTLAGESLLEQFDQACGNVVEALAAAGGRPEHIVSMQIFVTDGDEYRASLEEIGERWRRHFDRHYPAMSLLEVEGLFDPGALVELMGTAVIPEETPEAEPV
ncbi:MAG TPA: RidA family protein [Actinomycetota bacterium]|nr:RidA family protein [Gemmatimonadales bacterium]